ncbi:hypothetical protein OG21DRAFT_1514656 [Imleria badia]|nr:hypothetical protein OG21DRAFT_1514656 [Imleria badia]
MPLAPKRILYDSFTFKWVISYFYVVYLFPASLATLYYKTAPSHQICIFKNDALVLSKLLPFAAIIVGLGPEFPDKGYLS